MDATGKLPGGMIMVAVSAILLMAIVVPVTGSMAGTLDDSPVENAVPSGAEKAVYSEGVKLWLTESGSTRFVQIDDGARAVISGSFWIFSDSVVANFHADGVHFFDRASSGNLGYPVTVTLGPSGLTIADGQELHYADTGWILYTWIDSAGYPEATHAMSSLPAYKGQGQAMVHYNVNGSGHLDEYAYYEGGSQAHRIGGGTYDMTVESERAGIVKVTAASNNGASVTSWLVPLTATASGGSAIVHTLVAIIPVLLAAALVVALAAWMAPGFKAGGRDDVFTSR